VLELATKKTTKSAAQTALEEAVRKRLATTLTNLAAQRDTALTGYKTNYDTQSAQISAQRDNTLTALAAALQQQDTEAEQEQAKQVTAMQQSVDTDALRRGMARSSLPITLAADNLANINAAYQNAKANRLNTYNSNVGTVTQQAAADLSNLLNAFNANTAEANLLANTSMSEAQATADESLANIMAQYASLGGGGSGSGPSNLPSTNGVISNRDLMNAYVKGRDSGELTPAEQNSILSELNRRNEAAKTPLGSTIFDSIARIQPAQNTQVKSWLQTPKTKSPSLKYTPVRNRFRITL
jgi:hypothetical protein